jgi:propanol-preferring alcohol dehydrogenase
MATQTPSPSPRGVEDVRRYLDEHDVPYAMTEHRQVWTAAAEARVSGAAEDRSAKAIMLRDSSGYRMAVIPASERLDMHKVRRATGAQDLTIAGEADLARDFPRFEVGALPPFGSLFRVPEIVDRRIVAPGKIICNGGDHRHSLVLDSGQLLKLEHPQVADVVARRAVTVPDTMVAYRLTAWQAAPELDEVPVPVPGPGEVLVRVGGAGACHSDLHLMDWPAGELPFDPPFTLGHENAGWVHELGAGVTGVRVGEPVAVHGAWGCGRCPRCRAGAENLCERQREIGVMGGGLGRDGGMAEYLLVPSAHLLLPLGDLDPRDAAPLGDAALTPYHAIKRSLPKLTPGSTAVVIGVGGLGHMAVQILVAMTAAQVIAVDPSVSRLALAGDVGADVTLQGGPDTAEAVREATGGRGAELVLDMVGSDETLALAAACARAGGDVTLVGLAGGSLPFSFFTQPYDCSLTASYWGGAVELHEVLELARAGRIQAHVQRFPLEQAPEVYDRLRRGEVDGRAVICPNG